MQKIYCYVDESGQDTKGKLFLVSVVITDKDKEILTRGLEKIERESGKGNRKWFNTNKKRRRLYIEQIIESGLFKNKIFYSKYNNTKAYVDLTILTTAKAILSETENLYRATILVDGLVKTERFRFTAGLRKLKIKVYKVRGANNKNDSLIRLADAMVGFVRDYIEEDTDIDKLYKKAIARKVVREI